MFCSNNWTHSPLVSTVQWPLTFLQVSSKAWDWLWCPGRSPLVSIAFFHRLPYLGVFPLSFLTVSLDFFPLSFFATEVSAVCTHWLDHFFSTLGEFPGLELSLVPLNCGRRGGLWVRKEQKFRPKFLSSRGLNLGRLAYR